MQVKFKQLLTRTLVAKAFAKKAPIIGALISSEDVLKNLRAASGDLITGHPEGAKNELQQAVTHAVGATVNFVGGVSLVGMSAGLIAQTMAQRYANQIAAQKPIHPNLDDDILSSVVKRAKRAGKTAKIVEAIMSASKENPTARQVAGDFAIAMAVAAIGAGKIASQTIGKMAVKAGSVALTTPMNRTLQLADRIKQSGKAAATVGSKLAGKTAAKGKASPVIAEKKGKPSTKANIAATPSTKTATKVATKVATKSATKSATKPAAKSVIKPAPAVSTATAPSKTSSPRTRKAASKE